MRLYHISENRGIERFEPRAIGSDVDESHVVWAIDEAHSVNYLLPRDCPRVCFRASHDSLTADVERYLGESSIVIAIESSWLERAITTTLYLYQLDPEPFVLRDGIAGYHVSQRGVDVVSRTTVENPMLELERRGVEVRVLPTLWSLHDAIAASSLAYSMIRMRNARPR